MSESSIALIETMGVGDDEECHFMIKYITGSGAGFNYKSQQWALPDLQGKRTRLYGQSDEAMSDGKQYHSSSDGYDVISFAGNFGIDLIFTKVRHSSEYQVYTAEMYSTRPSDPLVDDTISSTHFPSTRFAQTSPDRKYKLAVLPIKGETEWGNLSAALKSSGSKKSNVLGVIFSTIDSFTGEGKGIYSISDEELRKR